MSGSGDEFNNAGLDKGWHSIAEHIADRAVESMSDRLTTRLELRIVDLEKQLLTRIPEEIDRRVQNAIGMSPAQHAIDHEQVRQIVADRINTRRVFRQAIITTLLSGIIGASLFGASKTSASHFPVAAHIQKHERYTHRAPIKIEGII